MKVFLEQINRTQRLIAGLKDKIELVREKGLDEKFIAQLEADNNFIATNNEDIDKLKAEAKTKVRQINTRLIEVKIQVKKAKKIIKQNFEKGRWKEFGISDIR